MCRGYLIIVLHCHLPYVRHPEHEDFLEEDWFCEAVAESYVPLLLMLERLEADGVKAPLTLCFSPTLCEMFANPLLQRRCARYLERHVELAGKELARTAGTPFAPAAQAHAELYHQAYRTYVERERCNLLPAFGALARRGRVELLASAATHAILPLLFTEQSRRAQVALGLQTFQRHFGAVPRGFWLPECAYGPGVDALLSAFGVRYFFLDTHAILLAQPRPPHGVFAPVCTPAGPLAFGRDYETSRQVWSAQDGYPGHPDYREFYRDLGFDAELDYVRPYLHDTGARRYLGFKYYRVTGRHLPLERKEPYDPAAGSARAVADASHFVAQRARQVRRICRAAGIQPAIVALYDGELFGHWWWEGPQFLESVLRQVSARRDLSCATPSSYLQEVGAGRGQRRFRCEPAASSWGYGGYFEAWVNPSNDWIYARLLGAEQAMLAMCRAHGGSADALLRRALNQCARLLLLAQASDWPFLMGTGTAGRYASERFRALMARFEALAAQVRAGRPDEAFVADCEARDDPFPFLDCRLFAADGD